MHIGRAIIIPSVLALGVAGSLLTGAAIPVAAAHGTSVHVQAAAAPTNPKMLYHG
jgi:hypothetical protein